MKTKISIWQKIKRSITAIILCIFIIYYFRYKIWLLFKNQLIRIPELIFTKFAIGTIISINILIIFRYKIMSIIEIQIDNFIYTNFSSYYDWAIFITSLIFLVSYLSIKLKNKYVFSNKLITISICILLSYIFYKSQFLSSILSLLEPKPYDIIPLSCLSILVISFINKNKLQRISKRKQQDKKNNLLLGKALKETESDILNYSDIARQITEEVSNINNEESFAIGITKSWGSGKTTFLNYLKEKIKEKDEDSIIIEFSPWYSKSEIDIITLFFTTFSKELSKYHSSINNQLIKYLKLLLTSEKNIVTRSIDNFLKLFQDNKDISDLYDDINNVIKAINRKIYIVIDDIDRLYASEIIECLKIIRNTANFNNVIYFVAYDPIYVQNAINKEFGEDSSKYIDKIIQLTFELPEIEDYNIISYLRDKLSSNNKEDVVDNILFPQYIEFDKYHQQKQLNICKYFTNFRDCNKVLNLYTTYKNLLKEEVILSDLFLVCILRCLYPKEASIIYNQLDNLFKFEEYVYLRNINADINWFKKQEIKIKIEQLNKEKDKERCETGDNKFSKQEELENLEKVLKNIKPSYLINKINDNEIFLNLVNAIFNPKDKNIRSVCKNYNYKTYYNGVVSSTKIKYNEFSKLIRSKDELLKHISILKNNISKERESYKLKDLANKLILFTPETKDEFKIIIYGLTSILDSTNLDQISLGKKIDYFEKYSFDILKDLIDNNFDIPIQNINSMIKYYKFYVFVSKNYRKELNESEINKQFNELFIGLLDKANSIKDVLSIYNNIYTLTDPEVEIIYDPTASERVKAFCIKHSKEFLKELKYEETKHKGNNVKTFNQIIKDIFMIKDSNYQEFEDLLETTIKKNPKDQKLQEIGKNWQNYKNNNYEYFVPSNKKYNLSN